MNGRPGEVALYDSDSGENGTADGDEREFSEEDDRTTREKRKKIIDELVAMEALGSSASEADTDDGEERQEDEVRNLHGV